MDHRAVCDWGAVGATFYLEPIATVDVDVFVAFRPEPGKILVSPSHFSIISSHVVARWKVNTL